MHMALGHGDPHADGRIRQLAQQKCEPVQGLGRANRTIAPLVSLCTANPAVELFRTVLFCFLLAGCAQLNCAGRVVVHGVRLASENIPEAAASVGISQILLYIETFPFFSLAAETQTMQTILKVGRPRHTSCLPISGPSDLNLGAWMALQGRGME